jgi:hypothetical protein
VKEELTTDRASRMSYAPASGRGHFGRSTWLHRLREGKGGQACSAEGRDC